MALPENPSPDLSRAVLSYLGRDKFPYQVIGSPRLDCGDEVRHPSRVVPHRGETRTRELRRGRCKLSPALDEDRWTRINRIAVGPVRGQTRAAGPIAGCSSADRT
ncbi:hypothetical protein EVAR_47923_1 [Eumeta japonica]|uniref:Uncharacterized protein n=1 Tax=Eumeta variegata TaxID=151549 RepID=A0A4C1Y4W1_EUMVA|nr:hypothetical protein EVAR_47923_1 [Eumeta japonica]